MKRKLSISLSIILVLTVFTSVAVYGYTSLDEAVILPGAFSDDSSNVNLPGNTGSAPNIGTTPENAQQLSVATSLLPEGVKWQKYNMALSALGGYPPYSWFVEGLPTGVSFVMYTGIISGTPVQPGTSTVKITVFDSSHKSVSTSMKLVIKDAASPKVLMTSNGVKVKIGDYVQFGRYLGKPILWRVVNLDETGQPLLFSESILTFKPYDAAESGVADLNTEESTYAEDCGSSRWASSNLREWMNSGDKVVKYTTKPPTKAAVNSGINYYSEETGFLYNFTLNEKKAIEPVIHSAVLSSYDKDFAEGGELPLIHYYNAVIPSKAIENEDSAFYEMVTDKVFLLSIAEVAGFIQARGWDWKRPATAEARKQAKEYEYYEGYGSYWLRTTLDSQLRGGIVCEVDSTGDVNRCSAYIGRVGVCPALYLNLKTVSFESGLGMKTKPYIVKE